MEEERNLGGQREQASNDSVGTSAETMSAQDERTWSIIAHASVLVMPIGALIIWLLFKDRSEKVRFHALQALWYQLAWVAILIVYSTVSFALTIVLIGFVMFFLLPILPLVPLVHGCYAAYQVSQGVEYRYPYIADRIEGPRSVV